MSKIETKKKFALSPAEYQQVIKEINLVSISLIDCSAKLDSSCRDGKMNVTIKEESALYRDRESRVRIIHTYKMDVRSESSKASFVFMNASFEVLLDNISNFSDEAFEIYKTVNLPVITLPYFRELVQSITARMNIAPITLPFIKRA
jgi:preprotein translocase subunit SecB